jgi:pentatricopeptide repeat protein
LAAQKALDLDPQNVGVYVMLSNLYAMFGMWDEIEQLRELMKERGLKKDVGCSWIEVT